jgi:hypothetical protein
MTGPQPLNARRQQAIDLAHEGLWAAEIGRRIGMTTAGVVSLLSRYGIKTNPKPKNLKPKNAKVPAPAPRNIDRAEKMASMFRQGLTMEQIGEHFAVSRERVRQILKTVGLVANDGGAAMRRDTKRQATKARRDAIAMVRWGLDHATAKRYRQEGLIGAFVSQRNAAHLRGIQWRLTFPQWLRVWNESGKLALRGRGKHRYVMSRVKDEGGYAVGNVHIQLSTENNRQGIAKVRRNPKPTNIGVWCVYPNSSRPWKAKVARIDLGCFATEAEAVAARTAYVAANQVRVRIYGRGYAIINGKRGTRYQVMVDRCYVGTFKTPEEALAARQAFIDTQSALAQSIDSSVEAGNPRGDSRLVHAADSLAAA